MSRPDVDSTRIWDPPAPRRPRVLVVDDEASVRTYFDQILRDAGYDVVLAANGQEALGIAEREARFDLFVLDLVMPGLTGDELARHLRVRDPDARILYATGFSDRLFEQKPALWGHEAFLEKPISSVGLREAVSLLLFGHLQGPPRA